jgi:hypothetical protein
MDELIIAILVGVIAYLVCFSAPGNNPETITKIVWHKPVAQVKKRVAKITTLIYRKYKI